MLCQATPPTRCIFRCLCVRGLILLLRLCGEETDPLSCVYCCLFACWANLPTLLVQVTIVTKTESEESKIVNCNQELNRRKVFQQCSDDNSLVRIFIPFWERFYHKKSGKIFVLHVKSISWSS